eukprot:2311535-Pleurochrysis_carterae.AAC.3
MFCIKAVPCFASSYLSRVFPSVASGLFPRMAFEAVHPAHLQTKGELNAQSEAPSGHLCARWACLHFASMPCIRINETLHSVLVEYICSSKARCDSCVLLFRLLLPCTLPLILSRSPFQDCP